MAGLKLSGKLQAKLKEISKNLEGSVSVGFMEGAKYSDGTPVAAVAYWNEFGHGGRFPSPPRPFFRTMISNDSENWPKLMAGFAKASNYNGQRVYALMGEHISTELESSIVNFSSPALSPTTLMLRKTFGSNRSAIRARDVLQAQQDVKDGKEGASGTQAHPLIWTGEMLRSITYKVKT